MAAPSLVQSNWAEFSSVSSGSVTLSSVATGADVSSGNLLLAIGITCQSSVRSVTAFSDDNSNTWNIDEATTGTTYHSSIGSADNANAGATQITCTWNASNVFSLIAVEVSGADTTDAFDTADYLSDTTNDNNDKCSAGITTSSDVFCFAGGANNSLHSGHSAPSGWTMIQAGALNSKPYACAYVQSSSGLSSDEVIFTHAGDARTWVGSVAAYSAAAVAGATPKNPFGLALHGPMQRAVR